MFAVPGLLALILVEFLRPQEFFAALAMVPLLHIATALAILGFVLELRLGLARPHPAPHLTLTLLFGLWCMVTLGVRAPDQFIWRAEALMIPIFIYVLVAHGIQSFRMLQVMCGFLLAICLALSAIGTEQGLADYGCHRVAIRDGKPFYIFDGRPCSETNRNTCENEGAEPGADYVCEKVGLLGTQSDHGRVRYRGTLQDPNELSLVLGIAIPFALAFLDRRRTVARMILATLTIAMVGLCAYFTASRGGQLVFLTVLGVYFVNRYGLRRGVVIGVLLALPLLVLGGGGGGESSTVERTECWWVGLHLFVASPVFGVGFGQFTEHHYLTAHNSFILVAAELGLPGMLLWTSVIYVALKVPFQALRAQLPPVARTWALAVLASIAGLVVGSFFLSFAYKDALWIYVGLTGALYQAICRHDPTFRVTFDLRDFGWVALADLGLLIVLIAYTAFKMGW
jgi:hypothetical protein